MAWAKNGTPDTLSSTNKTMEISDITAYKFNLFLLNPIRDSGNPFTWCEYDNDTGSLYARRRSKNGAADTTATSTANAFLGDSMSNAVNEFDVVYSINIDGEEKLAISFQVHNSRASGNGASYAPDRAEGVHKHADGSTNPQYTTISFDCNSVSNLWATDSNLSALGTD
jgi:hypothetical protein